MIFQIYIMVIVGLVLRRYLIKDQIVEHQELVKLRVMSKTCLDEDLVRVWNKFFESYLYVFVNSKMIPTDKQFLEFRSSFIELFRLCMGNRQCEVYDGIFGGTNYFNIYLYSEFERLFNKTFLVTLIDINKEK